MAVTAKAAIKKTVQDYTVYISESGEQFKTTSRICNGKKTMI
jgi:hypothetical protein